MGDEVDFVRVRLFAAAKAAAGVSELHVRSGSIASICVEMIEHHSALAKVLPRCSFLIDGIQPAEVGGTAEVPAGAVLDVLPPFAGG